MVIPWQLEVFFALAAGPTTRLLGSKPEFTYGAQAVLSGYLIKKGPRTPGTCENDFILTYQIDRINLTTAPLYHNPAADAQTDSETSLFLTGVGA
jgi:hypothetical protein